MTQEQIEVLTDVLGDVKHLAEVAKEAPEPTRAVLQTQIFLIVQKIRYALGEKD